MEKEYFVVTADDLHPYECNGMYGGSCKHCDRLKTEEHDPDTCELCGLLTEEKNMKEKKGIEDKSTADELDEIALSRVTSVRGVLVQMWDRNVLSAYVDGKVLQAREEERGRMREIIEQVRDTVGFDEETATEILSQLKD